MGLLANGLIDSQAIQRFSLILSDQKWVSVVQNRKIFGTTIVLTVWLQTLPDERFLSLLGLSS